MNLQAVEKGSISMELGLNLDRKLYSLNYCSSILYSHKAIYEIRNAARKNKKW